MIIFEADDRLAIRACGSLLAQLGAKVFTTAQGDGPMLGFKKFQRGNVTIAGIELLHDIRKNQFHLSKLQIVTKCASASWNAVLAA